MNGTLTLKIAALVTAGLISAALAPMSHAQAVVDADHIARSLTTIPKAVRGADGKFHTPDPTVDLLVQFDSGKATLQPLGRQQLDQLAMAFARPELLQARFEIGGHTDRVGSHDYNMKLSADRANAARDYLSKQHGIALDRLSTQAFGYTRLADPANPTSGANRRVEIRHLLAAGQYGAAAQPVPSAQPYVPYPPSSPYPSGQAVPQGPAGAYPQPYPQQQPSAPGYPQPGGQIVPRY